MDSPARGIVPIELMIGENETDTALLREMSIDAKRYLEAFDWCNAAGPAYWGGGIGGIFGVFLFRIDAKTSDVDDWPWVIVGDIPPLHIVLDECKTPKAAAEMYVLLMRESMALAREGRTSPDVPPTGVEANPEQAEDLDRRLAFIQSNICPCINS